MRAPTPTPTPTPEDPDDARSGGLFHLQRSAAMGCALAQCTLARAHTGLEPSGTQFAYLVKEVWVCLVRAYKMRE